MDPQAIEVDAKRHAAELADTWQARVLRETDRTALGKVAMSVLAHNFDDAMPVLLRIAFPGFTSITAPFYCSAGKINKRGHVVADMITANGTHVKDMIVFVSTDRMVQKFRSLADRLKLNDDDRRGLFAAIGKWLVADMRLDPTMDPKDPDAKRLVMH